MDPKTIIAMDPCEAKRDNFIKYPEKNRRSMINTYKNYIRNLEVEVDGDTRFQQLLPYDITQHDINSNKSLRSNIKKLEWLKQSRLNSPLPQNPLNHANYISAMKNAFLASSLSNSCSYQPVNSNEAHSRMFDDDSSKVYENDWEVNCSTPQNNSENWLVIPEDRSKILEMRRSQSNNDDPDWSPLDSRSTINQTDMRVTRQPKNVPDSLQKTIKPEFVITSGAFNNDELVEHKRDEGPLHEVKRKRGRPKMLSGEGLPIKIEPKSDRKLLESGHVKLKRGRPKGSKNKITKYQHQDELSFEDIQAIERLFEKLE